MSIFEKYEEARASVTNRAKSIFIDLFPYIILLINVLFLIITQLYDLGLQNPFSERFFINLSVNVLSSTLCYACFVIYADKNARASNETYKSNIEVWEQASGRIRLGTLFERFLSYCKEQTDAEREEKRLALVMDHTSITVDQWNKLRVLTNKEISAKVKAKEISWKDAWYIKRAKGYIRVTAINPLIILCGVKAKTINDAGRYNNASAVKSIVSRPLTMLMTSSLLAGITPFYKGVSGGAAVFSMICSVMLIITSAFLGYSKGVSNAARANDDVKVRILFLERFEKSI